MSPSAPSNGLANMKTWGLHSQFLGGQINIDAPDSSLSSHVDTPARVISCCDIHLHNWWWIDGFATWKTVSRRSPTEKPSLQTLFFARLRNQRMLWLLSYLKRDMFAITTSLLALVGEHVAMLVTACDVVLTRRGGILGLSVRKDRASKTSWRFGQLRSEPLDATKDPLRRADASP